MNEDDIPPPRFLADGSGGSLLPGGVTVRELTFCVADLPEVRDFAALQARRAGMAEEDIGDYLVAVNEVATNAVTHGSAKARLRVWCEGGDLFIDVHDTGHWIIEDQPGMVAPHDYSTSGMGLWVARRLTKELILRTGLSGTSLTMRFQI
ncbi:ATP-binding protein [Sphaerisporangium album]|uniref:ATP-binding protein n=1 Tax=Sphaerisporangium album TaxID=509200 RepID=A0A367FT64_9ACTN|nr:ATP-binding protein [Sphaerisporangium album]RCG33119.1 ATP-binding protein [Sphaerisporangium album]